MENAVVVFARRGCCLGHVAKRLLLTHGVNPVVVEIGEEDNNNYDNIATPSRFEPIHGRRSQSPPSTESAENVPLRSRGEIRDHVSSFQPTRSCNQ
ncbi:unnamed protein product [Arabidopsis thaliana]|uniref:(thale cress) hypothetical protein n=1 Tax=Arabidopsis thaliana TaxID=3702 RepID=A0A7G2DSL8_ARATH|nr:unnamed protein product [Arabidopsis thaliana]